MSDTTASWEKHLEAALAMGLSPQEAYQTFADGFPGLVKAGRERREAAAAMLDAADEDRARHAEP